jgi:DNA-directed RNA polymerase subunit beta
MVGANVKEGDILVGKVIPKDSSDLSPEEKLLEDLFGKSAKQKDVSKRVEHGKDGVVFKVERFDSDNGETKQI